MTYQQANAPGTSNLLTSVIIRNNDDGTQSWIPNDPLNNDWIAYQAWVSAGNTPLPPA